VSACGAATFMRTTSSVSIASATIWRCVCFARVCVVCVFCAPSLTPAAIWGWAQDSITHDQLMSLLSEAETQLTQKLATLRPSSAAANSSSSSQHKSADSKAAAADSAAAVFATPTNPPSELAVHEALLTRLRHQKTMYLLHVALLRPIASPADAEEATSASAASAASAQPQTPASVLATAKPLLLRARDLLTARSASAWVGGGDCKKSGGSPVSSAECPGFEPLLTRNVMPTTPVKVV
jgi:hypothetical protein